MGHDPNVGAFMERDSLAQALNLYGYEVGSPPNFLDADGMQASRSTTTSAPSGPSELLKLPDVNDRLLEGETETKVDMQQGARKGFKWAMFTQGRAQLQPDGDYILSAFWQLFLHDIDYNDARIGKGATLEMKQWVKARNYRGGKWGDWPAWATDMKGEGKQLDNEQLLNREKYTGPFNVVDFGTGMHFYTNPKAGAKWQQNKMVYLPGARFEWPTTTYKTISWWDGPGFGFSHIDKSQKWEEGFGRQWWFYIEIWRRCGNESSLLDKAQFYIGLEVRSTGKKTPIESRAHVGNMNWL